MNKIFSKNAHLLALILTLFISTPSWATIICKLNGPTLYFDGDISLTLRKNQNFDTRVNGARAPSLFCLLGANPPAVANAYITSSNSYNGYGEIATGIPGVAIQLTLGANNWSRSLPYTLNDSVTGLNMQNIGTITVSAINRTPGSLENYTGPTRVVIPVSFKETRQKQVNATNVWVTIVGTINVIINVEGGGGGTGGGGTGGGGTGGGGTGGGGTGGGGTGGGGTGGGIESCSLSTIPNSVLNFGDLRLDQLNGASVKRYITLKVTCSNSYPAAVVPVRIVSNYGGTSTLINSNKKEIGIKMTDDYNKVTGHGVAFNLIRDYYMKFGFSPIRNDGPLGSVEGVFSAGVVFQIEVP